MAKEFTEDQIRRTDLPHDVFDLVHDLCYHHEGRDVSNYVARAQQILRKRPGQLDHRTIAEMRVGFQKVLP